MRCIPMIMAGCLVVGLVQASFAGEPVTSEDLAQQLAEHELGSASELYSSIAPGRMEESLLALNALYRSSKPADALVRLYERSNNAIAKFYALVVLHELKAARFDELRADFLAKDRGKIQCRGGGCVQMPGEPPPLSRNDPRKLLAEWTKSATVKALLVEEPAKYDTLVLELAERCLQRLGSVVLDRNVGEPVPGPVPPPHEVVVFNLVYRAQGATAALERVYDRGTTAAKLYALLALDALKSARFAALKKDFLEKQGLAKVDACFGGCAIEQRNPKELLKAALEEGTVRKIVLPAVAK
jgi:hypothetical protein